MSSEIKAEETQAEAVHETEVEVKNMEEETVQLEEEDEEALPHSEFLDIFEEGLALIVQDPLLCDLPIQVCDVHSWHLNTINCTIA